MTDKPKKRLFDNLLALFFGLAMIGLCWELTGLPWLFYWILAIVTIFIDGFVVYWSMGNLPDSGKTKEQEVYGWWMICQVLVLVVVTAGALVHSGIFGLIVMLLLLFVFFLRTDTINRVMDLRVW